MGCAGVAVTKDNLCEFRSVISLLPSFGVVKDLNLYSDGHRSSGFEETNGMLEYCAKKEILFQRMEKDTIYTILLPMKALIRSGHDR